MLLRGALDYAEEHGIARAANRALNNLIVVAAADGTRGSGELYARGIELTERNGNLNTAARMASGQAAWLTRMYRFDEALEAVDDAARYSDYELFENVHNFATALAVWAQTGNSEAVLEARAHLKTKYGHDDPQLRETSHGLTTELILATGDYRAALEEAKKVGIPGPWMHPFEIALISALSLGDRKSLDEATEFAEVWQSPGRRHDGHRLMVAAGESMLNGETADAITAYVNLIDLYDEALTTAWGVYARLAFASTVGLDITETCRAAEEAYATLEKAGAYHLLEMWKDVLPTQSAEAAS